MEILMKDRVIDRLLEETVAAFYELCPETARIFEDQIREESASLVSPSGLSKDGTLLSYCKLPQLLWAFLKFQGKKRLGTHDFFRDKSNFDRLVKVWRACAIKRRPTQQFQVKLPKEN